MEGGLELFPRDKQFCAKALQRLWEILAPNGNMFLQIVFDRQTQDGVL